MTGSWTMSSVRCIHMHESRKQTTMTEHFGQKSSQSSGFYTMQSTHTCLRLENSSWTFVKCWSFWKCASVCDCANGWFWIIFLQENQTQVCFHDPVLLSNNTDLNPELTLFPVSEAARSLQSCNVNHCNDTSDIDISSACGCYRYFRPTRKGFVYMLMLQTEPAGV